MKFRVLPEVRLKCIARVTKGVADCPHFKLLSGIVCIHEGDDFECNHPELKDTLMALDFQLDNYWIELKEKINDGRTD